MSTGRNKVDKQTPETTLSRLMDNYPNPTVVDGTLYTWSEETNPQCWCKGSGGNFLAVFLDADSEPHMVFDKTCEGCEKGREEETRKTALMGDETERWRRKVREKAWEEAQIPLRFQSWRLNNSPAGSDVITKLRAHGETDTGLESWFLWGASSRGKTGLAIGYTYDWLMQEIEIEGRATALFRSVPDLFSELRSAYSDDGPDEMSLLRGYADVGMLILDDIGAEQLNQRNKDWLLDRLYQIIGKRHSEMRPIFFTSNLSMPELGQRLGERLTWRIIEMCGESHIVELKGPNLRDVKRQ